MTTEEKLQHFLNFCMEDAHSRSTKMLDEYHAAFDKTYEEHVQLSKHNADTRLSMETAKIEREINRQLSLEQINIKRTIGHKQEELKDMLFSELRDMLGHYFPTPEYQKLLEQQIMDAKAFAGDKDMVIYMDPVDEHLSRLLAMNCSVDIKISEYSFLGGTRAVISELNVLIDNSFATKLEEIRHKFHFDTTLESIKGGSSNE